MTGKPSRAARYRYKRAVDLAIIVFAHLALLPLWALLWLAIPLAIWLADRGPVFYVQERLGREGRPFRLVKFRTMVANAEAQTGPVWASDNMADPRITPVGRTLRRLRLDEMPQIINVLKGEMSLVGPRPERPALAEQFCNAGIPYQQRLRVRPGIAGLAQVRANYSTGPRHKLMYDNIYIANMCLRLDAKLLVLSAWTVFKRIREGNAR